MSNLSPNPFNNVPGAPQVNANPVASTFNNTQQFGQVPLSQLPPGYVGAKQDANSNSPLHGQTSVPQNHVLQNVNNFHQRVNSSPVFNQSGILPPPLAAQQSSPIKPPLSVGTVTNPLPSNVSSATDHPSPYNANPSPIPYSQNVQPPQCQINDNAPPLIPSSQFNQPLMNGPQLGPMLSSSQLPASSALFSSAPVYKQSVPPGTHPMNIGFSPVSKPSGSMPTAYSGPLTGPQRNSPLLQGSNGPPINGPLTGPPSSSTGPTSINGPSMPVTGPHKPLISGLPPASKAGPYLNGPTTSGPPIAGQPMAGQPMSMQHMSRPPLYQPMGPSRQPLAGPLPAMPGPLIRPPISGPAMSRPSMPGPPILGPPMPGPSMNLPPMSGPSNPPFSGASHPMNLPGPQSLPNFPPSGPQSLPAQFPPRPAQPQPPLGNQMGLPSGPSQMAAGPPLGPPAGPLNGQQKTNMQSRYPQMQQPSMQANMVPQYPQQYNTQNMTQQMGNLSVTKQGFDQLWGHQTVDLMQCKHILPEYPEEPPEIKLGPQFPDAVNCSPDIFRCTVNRIPETNSLLQKSRLPLGILIHPFKDLNHLPVIQCNTIVRCRSCRTYINPFVYFVDAKRWKCNLCFRVNDLPEEFLFDPVSKSFGDPSRRPEIKSATIEFIAPGEYMLRPPQPAVYLFLFDVSQIARESGYLQVVCDTLKGCLDELPGDARTQIGFICFDSHVHYYLMSEGLTRPKEMTVIDIEDIFVPSPDSLLVNVGERREMVRELVSALPQRHAAPGAPASALGAALQAAYKLMAPTGGRISVFQTCLPNTGPGALQPREDPNARSSKDVAHLNPATDFYKRLALDCSGAQVAVDLFLLNSQYSDLATLSGMSKFSGGTVYHIPLFKASRVWQAEQLTRMFNRYLTRKIGFEAVMRVRATRGLTIHTFHGNFFVRSTDLLSLPNVSPDAGFGMQLTIEESLHDLQHVCFQAALLYTSSKGERRIRVHTMSLPVATTLPEVLHSADTQCIIGLLSKMAVDRAQSASLGAAREGVMHVAVEALGAARLAHNLPAPAHAGECALHAPHSLRLLPLYLLALLMRKAFRTGLSTRLDDRVSDMCALKSQPLAYLMRGVYPNLYPIHTLQEHLLKGEDDEVVPDPPRLQLTAERINSTGAYLLDDGETMIIYVCRNVSPAFLSETFGVTAFTQMPDEARTLPALDSDTSALLHAFIDRLNEDRPYASDIIVLRDNSPSRHVFTERLIEDRVESSFSYYEFLQHVRSQVK